VAAPPIADLENIRISARIVPSSASYFTGKPRSTDELLYLQYLVRKNETLPVVKPGQAPRIAFQTLVDYRNTIGETVKSSKYKKTLELLHRLNHIHPDLKNDEVKAVLEKHKRAIDPFANVAKPITVDKFGRAVGTGRRKTSTARAWLVEGTGEVMVNGKSLVDAFARVHDRESAIWALKATERLDKYNVWALAEGGGTTGQAEAMTLAVAKALMAHEPLLKSALRRGKSQRTRVSPTRRHLNRGLLLTVTQLDVSEGIREWWRERSQVTSRPGRCRRGSSVNLVYTVLYCTILVGIGWLQIPIESDHL
jgi:small subunit ribosomal protein S9